MDDSLIALLLLLKILTGMGFTITLDIPGTFKEDYYNSYEVEMLFLTIPCFTLTIMLL